jgi:hypothetical protein
VEEKGPRPITGCARRSSIDGLKDAGSIPATSTDRPRDVLEKNIPSDLETPPWSLDRRHSSTSPMTRFNARYTKARTTALSDESDEDRAP